MTGRVDLRYDMPLELRIKRRFTHPDGKNVTRGVRIAVESAVVKFLQKNKLTLRRMVEQELKAQGFVLTREKYQRDMEAYDREYFQMTIWPRKTCGTIPE